mgnify:CR=1 FL=1
MNKFLKQVVNSVAVQAAVYVVTEGSKVIWPKAKSAFNKAVNKVESGVMQKKHSSEFTEVIKNTESKLKEELADLRAKKAAKPNLTTPLSDVTPPTPSAPLGKVEAKFKND